MRIAEGGRLFHWCPACEMAHAVPVDTGRWTFNGSLEAPTFTPSLRQLRVRDEKDCHYFITDGNIVWCSDSWHGRTGSEPLMRWDAPGVDLDWL